MIPYCSLLCNTSPSSPSSPPPPSPPPPPPPSPPPPPHLHPPPLPLPFTPPPSPLPFTPPSLPSPLHPSSQMPHHFPFTTPPLPLPLFPFHSVPECRHKELRLVGGATRSEGAVQMCVSHGWSAVCDRSWSSVAALVVCRQLGASQGIWLHEHPTHLPPPPPPPIIKALVIPISTAYQKTLMYACTTQHTYDAISHSKY